MRMSVWIPSFTYRPLFLQIQWPWLYLIMYSWTLFSMKEVTVFKWRLLARSPSECCSIEEVIQELSDNILHCFIVAQCQSDDIFSLNWHCQTPCGRRWYETCLSWHIVLIKTSLSWRFCLAKIIFSWRFCLVKIEFGPDNHISWSLSQNFKICLEYENRCFGN